jgi:hypothetical protein
MSYFKGGKVLDPLKMLDEFLKPEFLRQKLIQASVFIAVYENFKSSIVDNVKYFYRIGFEDGKELIRGYEENVLSRVKSKNNRQIKATLLWYKEHGAISNQDIEKFKTMTDLRNVLSHELLGKLLEGLPENILDVYFDMIALFEKITKWWIMEIEVPTSPDFTPEQYDEMDWDDVSSVALEFIKMMTDIAFTGNEEYLEQLRKMKS